MPAGAPVSYAPIAAPGAPAQRAAPSMHRAPLPRVCAGESESPAETEAVGLRFVHGFAKSDRENLRRKELSGLRSLADEYLALDAAGLAAAQAIGAIIEVECDDQAV